MNNPLDTALNRLWSIDCGQLSPFPRRIVIVLRILHLCIRDFSRSTLSLQAMGLVYTTLLSLVPLLAVSFSVLKAFGVHNQIEPALLNLLTPLGEKSAEITGQIVGFVENIRVGVLGVVGIVVLFYTVISLLQKIELACNGIWRVAQERGFVQRFSEYLSVIMIGPVLVFAAIALTASASSTQVVQVLLEKTGLAYIVNLILTFLPYFTAIAGFTFVYMFIPNTRVKISSAIFGAFIAGTLWQTLGWVFANMVVGSTSYTAVYSGLAILILFMVWLYLSWTILLFGASASFYFQYPEFVNRRDPDSRLNHAQREQLALVCLFYIAERHQQGRTAPTISDLTLATGQPGRVIEPLLEMMQRQGFVLPGKNRPVLWLPARAAAKMPVTEILATLRGSRHLLEMPAGIPPAVTELLHSIDACLQAGMGQVSLADVIEKNPATAEEKPVQKPE